MRARNVSTTKQSTASDSNLIRASPSRRAATWLTLCLGGPLRRSGISDGGFFERCDHKFLVGMESSGRLKYKARERAWRTCPIYVWSFKFRRKARIFKFRRVLPVEESSNLFYRCSYSESIRHPLKLKLVKSVPGITFSSFDALSMKEIRQMGFFRSLHSITDVTQHRTLHPGYPAVQLRLTCDQIRTGSES